MAEVNPPNTNNPGSTTVTATEAVTAEAADDGTPGTATETEELVGAGAGAPTLTLRLRPRPTVTWGADVINNEGMGKKSSKRKFRLAECITAISLSPNLVFEAVEYYNTNRCGAEYREAEVLMTYLQGQ